ncbi:aromatic ring-opening dioxygenase subunit LigA [Cupriavidus sp. TMH.W2]|uniref:aromatic ring-opening dioxygenase subunit LigA n=1 Tax=Cupriavidus sp. TMH.W2 TaxID=3434465 RepID=UPI003D783E48
MSLYALQKAIYELNRDPAAMKRYLDDTVEYSSHYELTEEESRALCTSDVGLLYVLGVNGQLLMHYAAACGYEWSAYIEAMEQGLSIYGPVRAGLYATIGDRQ